MTAAENLVAGGFIGAVTGALAGAFVGTLVKKKFIIGEIKKSFHQ
ncbi:MAG: hypothetical protein ABI416_12510 [Ginsengibacter sp.]